MATTVKRQRADEEYETNARVWGFDEPLWSPYPDHNELGDAGLAGDDASQSPNKKHRTSGSSAQAASPYMLSGLPDGSPSPPSLSATDMIAQLDVDSLRSLLTTWAVRSPVAHQVIRAEYNRSVLGLDLAVLAVEVQSLLLLAAAVPETGMGEDYHAYSAVRTRVDAVGEQVRPNAPFAVKRRALEALHDIALCILRAERTRRAVEVRRGFEQDDCIPRLMMRIVESMSPEERVSAAAECTTYGAPLLSGLQYVHNKAVEEYLAGFYDLGMVIEALGGVACG